MTYYAFTTLSTVGFGDYHPKSNTERIFIAFFMLLGVAVFSYIMGNFILMIDVFKNQNADNEYNADLLKFFSFLDQNYNYNTSINLDLKDKITKFFAYKWENDKNMIYHDEKFSNIRM